MLPILDYTVPNPPPTSASITITGATLGGEVFSDGGATITERGVVYSVTATNSNPLIGGTGVTKATTTGTTGVFTVPVTGLAQGTGYSYKTYATNSAGTTYSAVATFTTLSSNADLSALVLSSGTLSPVFSAGTTTYTASVSNSTTSITVTPTRAQANATIEARVNTGAYAAVTSGSPSAAQPLNVGTNTVDVRVTAQDGTTQKTYTVTVTRMAAPTVTTPTAASITATGATLGGNVSGDGGATITERGVVYSATGTNNDPLISGAGVTKVTASGTMGVFTAPVTGLTQGTGYSYKAYAINSQGTTYTSVATFTTLSTNADLSALTLSSGTLSPVFASATTAYTASVSNTTASITVTPTRAQANATIEARVNTGAYAAVTSGSPSAAQPLNVGTNTVDVRVTAQDGTTQKTYTVTVTRMAAPTVTTPTAASITATGATLGGNVTADGGAAITERGVVYSATATNNDPLIDGAGVTKAAATGTTGVFTTTVSGLAQGTGYSYKAYAINSQGTTYTSVATFTTLSTNADLSALTLSSGTLSPVFASATTAYTASVSNTTASITVTPTRAQANATIEARVNGGTYAAVTSGSPSASLPLNVGSNTVDVRVTAQDGTTQKTYTVVVTRGTAAPTAATPTAASITATGATLGGNVTNDGSATITERGVVYSVTATNNNPTIGGTGVTKVTATGTTGVFTAPVTGLTQGTGYSYKAYAINSQGTTYTSVATFTTLSTNADLSALTLSSGTLSPVFASATTAYTVSVSNATTAITVTPTRSQANAAVEVRVNGGTYVTVASGSPSAALPLNLGSNTVDVRVTAQDGTNQKTYTVSVTRMAAPAVSTPIATLIITTGATLGGNVTSDGGASITERGVVYSATATNNDPIISGTGVTKVTASGTTGIFTAPVTGLAQGTGYSYKVYAINSQGTTYSSVATFTSLSTNADLSGLILSSGTLSPTFTSDTTAYTTSVTNGTTSITTTVTRAQANATIEVRLNGGAYASMQSGTASAPLPLNVDLNTLDVRVTAQDGVTQKTYIVTLNRLRSYLWAGFAGTAEAVGSADGTGAAAAFAYPGGVALDGAGNVYVADTSNHTIRKITPAGVVSTLAGLAGTSGSADGSGAAARFSSPGGLAVAANGDVYVADTSNHTIRRITSAGLVTTFAGSAGITGSTDGPGKGADFLYPNAVAVDGSGNVYVADTNNHTIRRITLTRVVSTLAGTAGSSGSTNDTGAAARFSYPMGIAVGSGGVLVVADQFNHTLRRVSGAGVVTTLAGAASVAGSANGPAQQARFNYPAGVAVDAGGRVYVADSLNHTIRRMEPDGTVLTIGGLAESAGSTDGADGAGRFSGPMALAVDSAGRIYVADQNNSRISRGTPAAYPPSAALTSISGLTSTTVTLGGSVTPNGLATTAVFDYGLTTAYGSTMAASLGNLQGTSAQDVSASLTGLLTGSTYYYRLRATNVDGTQNSTGGTFTTLTMTQVWRQTHFGNPANTGSAADAADPDSDGLPNLLEYALNLPPNAVSRATAAVQAAGGNLEYTYTRGTAAYNSGTSFQVEWSDDLTTWFTTGVVESLISDDGTHQQVKATLPAGSGSRRFVRLRVQ
jgi:hypothetical protein